MRAFLLACFLFVAAQAAPTEIEDAAIPLQPMTQYMPVIEGAPKYPAPRIVNGNQASRGQFPHQAALYLDGRSFCGGSLISTSVVLTAAHCNRGITTITVYLGAQNLNAAETGRVILESRNHVFHANYNPNNLNNDIAIVRLPSAVSLSSFIQLAALPRTSEASQTFAGVTATASGWGRPSDASSSISPELRWTTNPVITNAVCSQTYGSAVIVASTICVSGSGGRSTCNGDSGGPLIANHAGRNIQIGVVSFVSTAGCGSGNPSGYVRTGHFLSWISSTGGVPIS